MNMSLHAQQVDDLLEQYYRTGSVVFPMRKAKLVALLVASASLGLVGLAIVGNIAARAASISDVLLNLGVWLGLSALLFFGVLGVPILLLHIVRGGRLEVDRRGFRLMGSRGPMPARAPLDVHWDEVVAVYLRQIGRTQLTIFTVTPEAAHRRFEALTPIQQKLRRRDQLHTGEHVEAIASTHGPGAAQLVAFLHCAHQAHLTGRRQYMGRVDSAPIAQIDS